GPLVTGVQTCALPICARHGVKVAMVYSSVFPEIPRSWVPLGRLRLGKRRVTPADSVVMFWAVDRPAAAAATAELIEFQKTLPPRSEERRVGQEGRAWR